MHQGPKIQGRVKSSEAKEFVERAEVGRLLPPLLAMDFDGSLFFAHCGGFVEADQSDLHI